MSGSVKIYQDNDGETYIAESLGQLIGWLERDIHPHEGDVPPAAEWRELSAAETEAETLRGEDGNRQTFADCVRCHLAEGGEVPTQIATTYY